MMNDNIKNVKINMLLEFEKQINTIFSKYFNGETSKIDSINNIKRIKNVWAKKRVDLKNIGYNTNSLEFLEHNENIQVSNPNWFTDEKGEGFKLDFTNQRINLNIKTLNTGEFNLILRGIDFRDNNNHRIPLYLNFTNIKINDEVISEDNIFIWHNEAKTFKKPCLNDSEIRIYFECYSIYDYFPMMKFYLDNVLEITDDLNILNRLFNNYIQRQKFLME